MPSRVVAPITVNRGNVSGMDEAPGPLPTITSTRKSSMAMYSSSSAARGRRWISSIKSTSPASSELRIEAKSPACWMAGPEVTRIGTSNSLATIMAKVVLPSPGGPASRIWSGRNVTFSSSIEEKLQLRFEPWLSDESLEDMRTKLLVADRFVADGCGGNHTEGFLVRPGVRLFECISVRHNGPFHLPLSNDVSASFNTRGTSSASTASRFDYRRRPSAPHGQRPAGAIPKTSDLRRPVRPQCLQESKRLRKNPRSGSDQWNLSVRG